MRILFFCGSIQSGKDGVGDYTRRLAVECIRQGHEAQIIALNDRQLDGVFTSEEKYDDEGLAVKCLRLSSTLSWPERFQSVRERMGEFSPDLCSLQFVPFSFHDKGLFWLLGRHLKKAARGTPWHIMFHELWIDWNFPLALKLRFLGQMQKVMIKRLVKELRPSVINTHLVYYQMMLKQLGVSSTIRALHGNIPVVSNQTEGKQWLLKELSLDSFAGFVHLGFFGALLETLDLRQLESVLVRERAQGRSLLITSAGHLGKQSVELWKQVESLATSYGRSHRFGPLSASDVSHFLSSLDKGLTTYSVELSGKSGAVAAMHEHGIDVYALGKLRKSAAMQDPTLQSASMAAGLSHSAKEFLASTRL